MRYALAAVLVVCASSAAAQTQTQREAPEALAGVYACAERQNDQERLACYDAAVGRLRQAETQGQFVAVDRQQAETMQRESFGFSLPSIANLIGGHEENGVDRVQLQVDRVLTRADGRHVFVMADGQRWTQIEPRSARNVEPGDTITIRRAALGSFMLSPAHGGSAHRVRREN